MKLRIRSEPAVDESGHNANLFLDVIQGSSDGQYITVDIRPLKSCSFTVGFCRAAVPMNVEGYFFGVDAIRVVGAAELWALRCLLQCRSGFVSHRSGSRACVLLCLRYTSKQIGFHVPVGAGDFFVRRDLCWQPNESNFQANLRKIQCKIG